MKQVISVYLPTWPTDRLRRLPGSAKPSPDGPLVLLGRDGRRRVVMAADAHAQALGIRPGMAATQAHALVPDLPALAADPAEDTAALHRLAQWAQKHYSPIVAADPPDGLLIDATGATHLAGGPQAMLAGLVDRLTATGIQARAAMAATIGAAHALARSKANPILVACDPGALVDLPIAALRLPGGIVAGLHRLGFEYIGALEATPRAPLALRFGQEPGRRLDQAFGRRAEPITPVTTPDTPQIHRVFAEPIAAAETLALCTAELTAALCAVLDSKCLGARRLDLLFHRVDAGIAAIRIGTAKPARDAKHLARLLCAQLESIDPGFGIEAMTLSAPIAEPLTFQPATSRLGEAPVADIAGLIDTLANRVGTAGLYRLAPVESDIPERAMYKIAPLAPPTLLRWPPNWPRPPRLLAPPEPVETMALLPDNPPVQFTWRGIRRRIRRADGPERLYGEWHRHEAERDAVRDYFQVEDETGQRFWLFRAGDGTHPETGSHRWFLHGLFG